MENKVLNDKSLQVYVILAETLDAWKNPATEEGKAVLLKHYAWGAELKSKGNLILAGPVDFELISTAKMNPIDHITGLIMLKANSREEAEELAFKDPFHTNGFRKNVVHSLKITMTEDSLFVPLEKLIDI